MTTDQSQDHIDDALAAALAGELLPAPWPGERRAALRARVLAAARPAPSLMQVVRADEGRWLALLPGVAIKFLHIDPRTSTQSSLWRLDRGARIPTHGHDADEECIVLEGSVNYAGQEYRQGDFLLARAGLQHEAFDTATGTTLYIRSELSPALADLARCAGLIN